MDTHQLLDLLLADTFVKRCNTVKVLACDQLPRFIDQTKPAAFIINTDPISQPGSHWVAVYFDAKGNWEYCDSFGLPIWNKHIERFIQRNSHRPYTYNGRQLQDILTTVCGLYAVYFLLMKCRGASLKRLLAPFSSRQHFNDVLVERLVKNMTRR